MRAFPAWLRITRFWGPWVVLGVCIGGLLDHVFEDLLATWDSTSAQRRTEVHPAAAPLGCYRQRLGEFAEGIAVYRRTAFSDVTSFRAAAGTLVPLIVNANEAYIALARQHFVALFDAADGLALSPPRERAICMLRSAEEFHWNEQRTMLNSLLVSIIATWHHDVREQELAALRRQQAQEWERYEQLLRHFASEELLLAARFGCPSN